MGSREVPHFQVSASTGVVHGSLGEASLSFLGGAVSQQTSLLSGSCSLSSLLPRCFLSFRCRSCVVVISPRARHHMMSSLYFDLLWFFSSSLCCKGKLLWWGLGATFVCGYNNKHLECSQELCCFGKAVVIGSPLRSVVSLGLGSWLGFQYWA